MKFLLDHDVPDEVAQVLNHVGRDVALVREALSATATDPEIFGNAQAHRRIIIPCNPVRISWDWRSLHSPRNRRNHFAG